MYKIFVIFSAIFLSACSVTTQSLSKSTQTDFAQDFFTDQISSCGKLPVVNSNLDYVNDLLYVTPDRLYNSNSLTVKWNYIGDRILSMLDMTYTVASEKDKIGADKILQTIE